MKTDRELLELAAMAAGIKALRSPDGILRDCTGFDTAMNIFAAKPWNPLTDDGDALRLAARLKIDTSFSRGIHPMHSHHTVTAWADGETRSDEFLRGDEMAAIRRAIVRAAAAIGRADP